MIYEHGPCTNCDGCGEISVFRPRSFDPEPYREVPCPSCLGTGVVPVGVLSAEELSARIEGLQRHASHLERAGRRGNQVPQMPATSDTVRDHAPAAE